MSIYFFNRSETRGAVEHMDNDLVQQRLSQVQGLEPEVEEHNEAHKALKGYFLTGGSGAPPDVLQEVDDADDNFDAWTRTDLAYFDYLLFDPRRHAQRAAFSALRQRFFPKGGATVNLSFVEEAAVAEQAYQIMTQDEEVKALIADTELPALLEHLHQAAQRLTAAYNKAIPQTKEGQPSYKELRLNWLQTLSALRQRLGVLLQRKIRHGVLPPTEAHQVEMDIFHAIDQLAEKAASRRNLTPQTP